MRVTDGYWQCPNNEKHTLTFLGLPLWAKVPYCKECLLKPKAVFRPKHTPQPSSKSVSQ